MPQGTVDTEDLLEFEAANWFQLEAYLRLKAPDDSPFKVERRAELLNGIEKARKAYELNPIYIVAHAIWDSAWGKSIPARFKSNLFGWAAEGGWSFRDYSECLDFTMRTIKESYLTLGGRFFNGATLKGMNINYSSDRNWATGIRHIMNDIDAFISSDRIIPQPPPPISSDLGVLTRYLSRGKSGDDALKLQKQLAALDIYHGPIEGIFCPLTEEAVKQFQGVNSLAVDGIVGPETWKVLGGSWIEPNPRRVRLAEIACEEANKNLSWTDPDSEAEKYLALLREPMRRKGFIGQNPVFFNWSSAFALWCCLQAGFSFPEFQLGEPANHWATFALNQAWYDWAIEKKIWYPCEGFFPEAGDIVIFDWPGSRGNFNHIGIVKNYQASNDFIESCEGNVNNRTAYKNRKLSVVAGFIRID